MDFDREIYLGFVLDRASQRVMIVASSEGGMEIEEISARKPDSIVRSTVEPALGLQEFQAREIAFALKIPAPLTRQMVRTLKGCYRAFRELDATMVEINPPVITADNRILALDASMTFDGNALFRHPHVSELRDKSQEDPREARAADRGLAYIGLTGNIGCMVGRSGTLGYEAAQQLKDLGIGVSTSVGIGGDPINGSSFRDILERFEADPETHVVCNSSATVSSTLSRRWSSGSSRPPAAVSARCRRSPPCIKFHSWIGGDRDGNPNVTARATAEAVQRSRQAVLEKYLTGIRAAAARIGITSRILKVPVADEAGLRDARTRPSTRAAAPLIQSMNSIAARLGWTG